MHQTLLFQMDHDRPLVWVITEREFPYLNHGIYSTKENAELVYNRRSDLKEYCRIESRIVDYFVENG